MVNVLVPCKYCKLKVPVSDLRKNKEGVYICSTCLSHGYMQTPNIHDLAPKSKTLEVKKEQMIKREDKINYYCSNCKFGFSKPSNSATKNCPYCNKEHTVQRKENAQELLKNVDDFFNV